MATVAERLDIASSLRAVSMATSQRSDVEANTNNSIVTEGWIRKWNEEKAVYSWVNKNTHEERVTSPFQFESPSAVPIDLRNQWFAVFDERTQRTLYVNPSMSQEQWNPPIQKSDSLHSNTIQLIKAHYLTDYAETHFNRSHGCFHSHESIDILLSYSSKPLKMPLLKMDSELYRIALLMNKEIIKYTESNHVHNDCYESILSIIGFLMITPEIIADECYCQLIKQMTNCHDQLIIDKAWNVLTIVCASILPSKEFSPYVEFFIQNSNNTVNNELPQRCLSCFTKCKKVGSRKEMPTVEEIIAILNDSTMHLNVHLLNNQIIELDIPYMTQAKEVVHLIGKQLKLDSNVKLFQLFKSTQQGDVIINENSRLADICTKLKESEFIEFAVAYYLPINLLNQMAVDLLYYQALHDIRCGRYFRQDNDYYTVIALSLQIKIQDYVGDNRLLCDEIFQLLPPHLSIASKRLICEGEIVKIYSQLRGYTVQECKLSLIEYMKAWNEYGVTHFYCDQLLPEKSDNKLLGISPKGIHIGEMKDHIGKEAYTLFYPYNAISAWGTSDSSFSFFLSTKPTQTRYCFIVKRGDEVFDLVKHYLNLYYVCSIF